MTSRCCAPSCRSRSSRRRSASPAATSRCRDALRLGVELLVLERDRGRRGDDLDQLGIVVERRVVDQRAAVDAARRAARRRRQGDGRAVRVGVARRRRRGRPRRGRVAERPWRAAPAARRRASSRSSPKRSARPPRASRERSRPARKAAGTSSSDATASQTSAPARGRCAAAKKSRQEMPATLGSIARRRGGEAPLYRAPIRAAVPKAREHGHRTETRQRVRDAASA